VFVSGTAEGAAFRSGFAAGAALISRSAAGAAHRNVARAAVISGACVALYSSGCAANDALHQRLHQQLHQRLRRERDARRSSTAMPQAMCGTHQLLRRRRRAAFVGGSAAGARRGRSHQPRLTLECNGSTRVGDEAYRQRDVPFAT